MKHSFAAMSVALVLSCNGSVPAPEEETLGRDVELRVEPPGPNCPNGGVAMVTSSDTAFVCNGTDGNDGADGVNGMNGSNGVDASSPAGTVIAFAGNTAPSGYLLCDGAAVSRTTYATLFSQIGITYGTGDGVTTFNVPDARGVFLRGEGTQVISSIQFTGTKGVTQPDAFRSHDHGGGNHSHSTPTIDISGGGYNGNGSYLGRPNGNNQAGTVANSGTVIAAQGGSETRPANIVVTYYIKH